MVFVTGQVLSAADLNGLVGDWTAYTPTWASTGTQPAIGNGTLAARYIQIGKLVNLKLRWVKGSTTTLGTGDWSFSLPVVPSATHANLETFGSCVSLAGSYRHDVCNIASGASIFRMIGVAAGAFYDFDTPAAWANGNFLNIALTYEVA